MNAVATVRGREVEVEYTVSGCYFPGNREEPPDWPDVEIHAVRIYRNGKQRDVLARLTDEEVERLSEECLAAAEEEMAEARVDWDEPDYSDTEY